MTESATWKVVNDRPRLTTTTVETLNCASRPLISLNLFFAVMTNRAFMDHTATSLASHQVITKIPKSAMKCPTKRVTSKDGTPTKTRMEK